MVSTVVNAKQVDRARTELFETGAVSEQLSRVVRPQILASWRRSAAWGAQPHVASLPFQDELGGTGRLFEAAEPVLRALAESLAGLHAGVLLADRDANIVQRWVADPSIMPALDRICSDAGFGAKEELVGTNGIGTVAELGTAQLIVGPEHYADALVSFACVGAPIHSPTTRRLEGIITLSCRADAANALLTPLMVSTAADIENRLLQTATVDERRVLDAYLVAKRRHRSVAAVGKDLLIASARVTRLLDQLVDRELLWEIVSDVVARSGSSRRVLETRSGDEMVLSCAPIRDADRLIGAVIEIDGATAKSSAATAPRPLTAIRTIGLVGESPRWRSALETAARYAAERMPTVVAGASGVGKWSVVKEMLGDLVDAPSTVMVDCADLAASHALRRLQASESPSPGAVVLRHLDALTDEQVRELGTALDAASSGVGSGWIVATATGHVDTWTAAQRRLVDRLGAVVLPLPDLDSRREDIPLIVRVLVERHRRDRAVHFSDDAVNELKRATWPGNVRQLENVVAASIASRLGEVTAAQLPVEVRSRSQRRSLSTIDQLECEAIIRALHQANGNKVEAARSIGLSRSTIYRKIRAYGIDPDVAFF
jgi:transcriptional regulator of acetoin/glycerol metabolism